GGGRGGDVGCAGDGGGGRTGGRGGGRGDRRGCVEGRIHRHQRYRVRGQQREQAGPQEQVEEGRREVWGQQVLGLRGGFEGAREHGRFGRDGRVWRVGGGRRPAREEEAQLFATKDVRQPHRWLQRQRRPAQHGGRGRKRGR
ncbi:unnamed protein product, partial [Scytosiphon promiscuus]